MSSIDKLFIATENNKAKDSDSLQLVGGKFNATARGEYLALRIFRIVYDL